jgi:hypothetical protein
LANIHIISGSVDWLIGLLRSSLVCFAILTLLCFTQSMCLLLQSQVSPEPQYADRYQLHC